MTIEADGIIDPVLGLQIPTTQGLLAQLIADQQASVDPNITTGVDSLVGNFDGITANSTREGYEAIQIPWDNIDPDNAEGAGLDTLCAITGTFRRPASASAFGGVTALAVVTTALIPAGSQIAQFGNPGVVFATTQDTPSGATTTTAVCLSSGPIDVTPGTLTVILTPISGWTSVTNPTGPVIGANQESDAALRARRSAELEQGGAGSLAALKANLLAMQNPDGTLPILSAAVYENTSDHAVNGLPPHCINIVIWDGVTQNADAQTLAKTIYQNKSPGVFMQGASGIFTPDPQGNLVRVGFDRAAQLSVYVSITGLVYEAKTYVGDTAVKEAIVEAAEALQSPGMALAWSVYLALVKDLPGVIKITGGITLSFTMGVGALNSDLAISQTGIAILDVSRISVASAPQ